MESPSPTWTMTFFHCRVRPWICPRRLGLDLTLIVCTEMTETSKSASTLVDDF